MDDSMTENVENFIADAQAEADPTPVELGQSAEETNGVLADTPIKSENDKASSNGQNHIGGIVYPYDDLSANDYSEDETYKKIIAGGIAPIVAAELMEALRDGKKHSIHFLVLTTYYITLLSYLKKFYIRISTVSLFQVSSSQKALKIVQLNSSRTFQPITLDLCYVSSENRTLLVLSTLQLTLAL